MIDLFKYKVLIIYFKFTQSVNKINIYFLKKNFFFDRIFQIVDFSLKK
jgi:hypothetical protein